MDYGQSRTAYEENEMFRDISLVNIIYLSIKFHSMPMGVLELTLFHRRLHVT